MSAHLTLICTYSTTCTFTLFTDFQKKKKKTIKIQCYVELKIFKAMFRIPLKEKKIV